MQLALPHQILLSGVAHSLAHRAQGELGTQLETVRWRTHGRYRFKGIPDPIPVFEVGDEGHAPLKAPPWSGKAHREVPFWRRPATMGIEIGLLLILLAIPAWYLFKPEPAIAFANRDWVVVGDLKNLTGEARFDEAIDAAFRIGLEQSRYVNVLSDLKTRETVQLMQQDPNKIKVDRAIGSEIALRDGARALILPTIAEIGGRVRVTAEVIDPNTQTTVYSESADGVGADSVLPSLDQVNQKLRVRLGEALATVSSDSRPLEKVATKNLDALRAYTLAEKAYQGRRKDALALYQQALKLDSDFALARVGLARTLFSADENSAAREQIRLAAATKDRLSPRDAFYVDAWQATFGPPMPALEKWKVFATLYPDFFPAAGSYGYFAWQKANRLDSAIAALETVATPRNPNRGISDYNLGALYLGKERYEDALKSFKRADTAGMAQQKQFYASAYAARRQFAKAEETLASGVPAGVPAEDIEGYITHLAIDGDQGQFNKVADVLGVATREASSLASSRARQFHGIDLSLRSLSDLPEGQAANLRQYLKSEGAELARKDDVDHANTTFNVVMVGYLAARMGDIKLANEALSENLSDARGGGYPVLTQMLLVANAEKARAEGRADSAITMLNSLLDANELCVVHVALMEAYATADKKESALKEARWLADHRGRAYIEINSQRMLLPFNVVQTNLAVLREAELFASLGKESEARNSLLDFQKAWPGSKAIASIGPRLEKIQASFSK
ncbi:MAG: putative peptide modification system cyclase [Dokdonella sp.]